MLGGTETSWVLGRSWWVFHSPRKRELLYFQPETVLGQ